MFIRTKKRGQRTYLQIVENFREGKKVRQIVKATLGRLDILQSTGQLDALLRSGLRFAKKLIVLDAHFQGECTTTHTKRIGPVILFEKLWNECHIGSILKTFLSQRKFSIPLERIIFTTVLSRLVNPGSDRSTHRWIQNYALSGMKDVELHHYYRTMAWLGETVSTGSKRPFGKNKVELCRKDLVEEALFDINKDLFSQVELVFFDTTSLYFEGNGGETIGQRGNSKDHRPDLKQMIVGIVLDNNGNPICSEFLPGNTADVTTLIPVAKRLQERFGISQICIVADRGMISEKTMQKLQDMEWHYILGARLRRVKEINDEVISKGGRYQEVRPPHVKSTDPAPLKVKEIKHNGSRYIICLNEDESRKCKYDREAIVAILKDKLKQDDKALVGNKGYRKYLKSSGKAFEIDQEKLKKESRFDGKYVLMTNTELPSAEVALQYKQLWTVEAIFRTMKSTFETRPIFHHCDETIRGHVFCSFLALLLRKKLQDKLEEKGYDIEWEHLIEDVDSLQEVGVVHKEQEFIIRTETKGVAGKVFKTIGVALPPILRN